MSPRRSVLVGMRGAAGLELVLNECQPDFVASSPILLLSEPGSFLDQLGIRHSSPDILHRKTSRIVRFGVDTQLPGDQQTPTGSPRRRMVAR